MYASVCVCIYIPGATLGKELSIPCRGARCLDCVTRARAASHKSVSYVNKNFLMRSYVHNNFLMCPLEQHLKIHCPGRRPRTLVMDRSEWERFMLKLSVIFSVQCA